MSRDEARLLVLNLIDTYKYWEITKAYILRTYRGNILAQLITIGVEIMCERFSHIA